MSKAYSIGKPPEISLPRERVSLEVKNKLQVRVMELFGCDYVDANHLAERWIEKAAPTFEKLLSNDCPARQKGLVAQALQLYARDREAAAQILKECLTSELGNNFMGGNT